MTDREDLIKEDKTIEEIHKRQRLEIKHAKLVQAMLKGDMGGIEEILGSNKETTNVIKSFLKNKSKFFGKEE